MDLQFACVCSNGYEQLIGTPIEWMAADCMNNDIQQFTPNTFVCAILSPDSSNNVIKYHIIKRHNVRYASDVGELCTVNMTVEHAKRHLSNSHIGGAGVTSLRL